jgi:hypothetical protein
MFWNIQEMGFNRSGLNDGSEVCGSQQCTTLTWHSPQGFWTKHIPLTSSPLYSLDFMPSDSPLFLKLRSPKRELLESARYPKWSSKKNRNNSASTNDKTNGINVLIQEETASSGIHLNDVRNLRGEKFQTSMVCPQTLWWSKNVNTSSLRRVYLISVFCLLQILCRVLFHNDHWSDLKYFSARHQVFLFFLPSFRKHGCMKSQNFKILYTGVCSLVDNIKMSLMQDVTVWTGLTWLRIVSDDWFMWTCWAFRFC